MKLAAASPKLLEAYGTGELTLDQLMAFCVSDDHRRQEEVWERLSNSYNREPYTIRRMLTEGAVRGNDRRARLVGSEAYEKAGGVILRDLFSTDEDGMSMLPEEFPVVLTVFMAIGASRKPAC